MKGPDDIPDGTPVYVDEDGGIHPVTLGRLPGPIMGIAVTDSVPLANNRHAVTVLRSGVLTAPTELHAVSPVYMTAPPLTRVQRLWRWLTVGLHKQ